MTAEDPCTPQPGRSSEIVRGVLAGRSTWHSPESRRGPEQPEIDSHYSQNSTERAFLRILRIVSSGAVSPARCPLRKPGPYGGVSQSVLAERVGHCESSSGRDRHARQSYLGRSDRSALRQSKSVHPLKPISLYAQVKRSPERGPIRGRPNGAATVLASRMRTGGMGALEPAISARPGTEGAMWAFLAGAEAPRRGQLTINRRGFARSTLVRRTSRRGIFGSWRASESWMSDNHQMADLQMSDV
jgi:hypothetical protein